jgi:hypothetical protein
MFKCVLVIVAGLAMGLALSMVGMLIVYRVNDWDASHRAENFGLHLISVGLGFGFSAGVVLSKRVWRNRHNSSQLEVWRTAKGLVLFLCATTIVPPALIIPWSGQDSVPRRVLSISVSIVLAAISFLLFKYGAVYLRNSPERFQQ